MKRSKICKACNCEKLMEEFPKRNNYRLNTCSICYNLNQNEIWRKRYAEDPEFRFQQMKEARRAQWKSKYGVSEQEVYIALDNQGGRCANDACGVEITLELWTNIKKRANVDHCHESGKFRSLLCNSCNTLLGRIEKDVSIVHGLIDYANRFSYLKEK